MYDCNYYANCFYTFNVNQTNIRIFSNPPNQPKNQPITSTPTNQSHTIPTVASSWRYCPIANAKAATHDGVPYPDG